MGNRAVISTSASPEAIGIYLHWNGGRDSVEAFLKYCELKRYRPDDLARLAQVIANYFGGTCSIEIDKNCNIDCDNWDNGMYIIKDWKIVGRKYMHYSEQKDYDMQEMLLGIDEKQPEEEQIKKFLEGEPLPAECFEIGDNVVWIRDGRVLEGQVVGIGTDRFVNGRNVNGIPYVAAPCRCHPEDNINNYLIEELGREYRIIE